MQHGPWSGATRPAPAQQSAETWVVLFSRGGSRATKLDGFCKVRNGRLELFDGPQAHANLLASRSFAEIAESFLAKDWVVLSSGYRVEWSGDTVSSLQAAAEVSLPVPATKKRRLTLGSRPRKWQALEVFLILCSVFGA